jgi:hypothetical protein
MTDQQKAAMQAALKLLEVQDRLGRPAPQAAREVIAALRAALAQQERAEPVATLHDDGCFTWKNDEFRRKYDRHRAGWRMDVFAAPPPRKPLSISDDRLDELSREMVKGKMSVNWLANMIRREILGADHD